MLFADIPLVRRIEAAECDLLSAIATSVGKQPGLDVMIAPIAGGVAVFAGREAPWNKLAGLGFAGEPDEADLERIEQAYAQRGIPLQVELSTLGEPAIARLLTRRGYELVGFEDVLGLHLPRERSTEERAASIAIDLTGAADARLWMDTVVTAFAHPDTQGVPSHESFPREALERTFEQTLDVPGFRRYLARVDGEIAGGAALRLSGTIAQFCGAATLPAYRRRGVQTSLLHHRLDDASRAGCAIAVITTLPGSKSAENAHRQGFELLYSRAVLVRAWS